MYYFALCFIASVFACDQIINNDCFVIKSNSVIVFTPPFNMEFPPVGIESVKKGNIFTTVYFSNDCHPKFGQKDKFAYLPALKEFYWTTECENITCLKRPDSIKNVTFHLRKLCQEPVPVIPVTLPPRKSQSQAGLIAGISVGIVAFVVVVIALIIVLKLFIKNRANIPRVPIVEETECTTLL